MRKWLKCEISRGMFSDEVTVKVHAAGGTSIAAFVPSDKIREGFVSVRTFEGNGKTFAVLPDEQQTSLAVRPADLQPA